MFFSYNGTIFEMFVPDPTISGDQRINTNVPLQGLFFLNSEMVLSQAELLAKRLAADGPDDTARIQRAYRLLYGRPAKEAEVKLGLEFLRSAPWPQYAQTLLSASEFYFIR